MSAVGLDLSNLTPIEARLMNLLLDGRVHPIDELIPLIDELSSRKNVAVHILKLRKKVANRGLMISYVITNGRRRKGMGYQMSRRLHQD